MAVNLQKLLNKIMVQAVMMKKKKKQEVCALNAY